MDNNQQQNGQSNKPRKQRLELTWIGKDEELKLEPRILIEDPEKSYGDPNSENMLIHGDNLLALKALEQDYTGKVKCIYIDPPYNTGNAFEHYDDGLEHSIWLSLMKPRLEILKKLLSEDGLIFVQIDDAEMAYLKVLMDDIFLRQNFINSVCVKMSHLSGVKMSHKDKKLPKIKEFILIYAKNKSNVQLNPEYVKSHWNDALDRYSQFIINKDEPLENWKYTTIKDAAIAAEIDPKDSDGFEKFLIKNAKNIFRTARNRSLPKTQKKGVFYKVISKTGIEKIILNDEEVLWAIDKFNEVDGEVAPSNPIGDIWDDIGINNLHNEGGIDFRNGKKPEKLLKRVINISTHQGDIVLDSFLGSGSTSAVAHKMNRKWIGIELGEHANTHCIPRLKSVVDGNDLGGMTKAVNWQGGGGFKFYNLAPSLLRKD
ncbi:MAG TPA: site-specific DNA-methyltransferase, partial [Saprospiraceae bacterium]|nr:site-specific DNA-methyltransferase [Saprospiraceae bacterium]